MYPLVNVYITMENHHVLMGKSTISMAIFNSYVCLPERVTLDQTHKHKVTVSSMWVRKGTSHDFTQKNHPVSLAS